MMNISVWLICVKQSRVVTWEEAGKDRLESQQLYVITHGVHIQPSWIAFLSVF